VLAIERNQQNQVNAVIDGDSVVNGDTTVRRVVDEYRQLALYDVFKGVVSKLIGKDDKIRSNQEIPRTEELR
jgi:hypothetical protein